MTAYERATVLGALAELALTGDGALLHAIEVIEGWKVEIENELAERKVTRELNRERVGSGLE